MEVYMSRKNFKKKKSVNPSKVGDRSQVTSDRESKSDTRSEMETRSEVSSKQETSARAGNDPAWYAREPQLLFDSANLPWSDAFGSPLKLFDGNVSASKMGSVKVTPVSTDLQDYAESIPGIWTSYCVPSIGYTKDRNDPINQMANQLYTQVRYANSGRKNYDPADLLIYTLTIEEMYSFINWCRRLYAYCFMYSQLNMYLGRSMLVANGVNPEDLKMNLANFRMWLNTFITNVSSYVIPSDVTYIQRKLFMYAGYYIENPYGNIKDQLYQFAPLGFYTFTLDSGSKGALQIAYLKGNSVSDVKTAFDSDSKRLTASDIMVFGNALLSKITGDEDFGLMSGDILKAFGDRIVGLDDQLPESGIIPVYDPYVLSQFKNTTIIDYRAMGIDASGTAVTISGLPAGSVTQDATGNIVSYQVVNNGTGGEETEDTYIQLQMRKVLSVENPQPGPGDVIEATRFTIGYRKQYSDVNDGCFCLESGTELVVLGSILTNSSNSSTSLEWVYNSVAVVTLSTSGTADYSDLVSLATPLGRFKFAPNLYMARIALTSTTAGSLVSYNLISNNDNYTTIGNNEIEKLHRCALFSLFFVPTVAKNINYSK